MVGGCCPTHGFGATVRQEKETVMAGIPKIPFAQIETARIETLKPNPRNARTHSKRQIKLIAESVKAFGFLNPVLIDGNRVIIAGHGRVEAAKRLGMTEVPVLCINHLTDDEKRAYVLADNQLAARAGWDNEILAIELQHLTEIVVDIDATVTGFEMPEIDLIIEGAKATSPEDRVEPIDRSGPALTRPGDRWRLGPHLIYCADALKMASYPPLMGDRIANVVFADPPYNIPVAGFVTSNARLAHREFPMAVGEMTEDAFIAFLKAAMTCATRFSAAGALQYWAQDWRHQFELLSAARMAGLEHLNTCVWVKDNGGMGGLYRSRHEFVGVFRVPGARHRNNVELGKHGRNRTNVWEYPGAATFSKASEEGRLIELHPTVKPVALIADALLDCSIRGDIVLDPFLGSGSTLMAAERTGRICRGIEIDPLYVDVAIRRWRRMTGDAAIHVETGADFAELETRDRGDANVG
jgi:DNA modification methylase